MAVDDQNLPKLVPSAPTPNVANVITSNSTQETVFPALNTNTTSSSIYPDNTAIVNGVYNNVAADDQQYFDSFPPGYRFCPLDSELIVYYLRRKILEKPLPRNQIRLVDLHRYNPDELSGMYPSVDGGNQWYFFTPRDKKYRNGTRPNRAAGTGYWKATGADKDIKFNGERVGVKKALVFYRGKPPKGVKSDWIMQEYRVDDESSPRVKRNTNDMRLDDFVLCKIYRNSDKSFRGRQRSEGDNQRVQENELERNGGLLDPPAMPNGYALSCQPYLPIDPALHLPPPPQHISMHIQPPSSQQPQHISMHIQPPSSHPPQHISMHIQPPSSQPIVPYNITNSNGFPAQCPSQSVNFGLLGHHPLMNIHNIVDSKPEENICVMDMDIQANLMDFDYTHHILSWNDPSPPSLESPEHSSIKKRQNI